MLTAAAFAACVLVLAVVALSIPADGDRVQDRPVRPADLRRPRHRRRRRPVQIGGSHA